MISYIYMLFITVVFYLWQGISKEEVDFFQMASNRISINIKYDYLYTSLKKADSLCQNDACISGKIVSLDNYSLSDEAKICKSGNIYYVFFSHTDLAEKPQVSLSGDTGFSVISVKDIPSVCSPPSVSDDETDYGLKYDSSSSGN